MDIFHKAMKKAVCQGVVLRRGEAEVDLMMKSKLDHYAPAVGRLVMNSGVREGVRGVGWRGRHRGSGRAGRGSRG